MKQILLILSILFSGLNLNAQIILHGDELKDTARLKRAQIVPGIVQPPDTILIVRHNPVVIMPPYVFLTQRQREKYDKLAYNVKKVWPYAKIIKRVYAQLTDSLSKIDNEEDQKAYIK